MLNTLMLYTMKLSIDLGGTNIRIAQVEKGNCLNKVSVSMFSSARCFYCAKPAFPAYSEYDE